MKTNVTACIKNGYLISREDSTASWNDYTIYWKNPKKINTQKRALRAGEAAFEQIQHLAKTFFHDMTASQREVYIKSLKFGPDFDEHTQLRTSVETGKLFNFRTTEANWQSK